MKLQGFGQLREHLEKLATDTQEREKARSIAEQFGLQTRKASEVEAKMRVLLQGYVPANLRAHIQLVFLFGGSSSGFAFGGDEVYLNLAHFADASSDEIAEIAAHEVFHAIQAHLMPELDGGGCVSPAMAAGDTRPCGRLRATQLMHSLVQEGTASLFDFDGAGRGSSQLSKKLASQRTKNISSLPSITAMFESLTYRQYYVPTPDEQDRERIYGLLFYGKPNDQLGYALGYTMAHAIVTREGKPALLNLLSMPPKQFILHYQSLAMSDSALPRFSQEFIRFVQEKL